MAVNADKPSLWKQDIARSVDFYNEWFIRFAPEAYRNTRIETTKSVQAALRCTNDLRTITPDVIERNPFVLPILRMATAPPLARDRLIGLAQVGPGLVKSLDEDGRIPPRLSKRKVRAELTKVVLILTRLLDKDIFPWVEGTGKPSEESVYRGATIVADRLCGAVANPIIRNAQEQRQLSALGEWLKQRGYRFIKAGE